MAMTLMDLNTLALMTGWTLQHKDGVFWFTHADGSSINAAWTYDSEKQILVPVPSPMAEMTPGKV